MFARSRVAPQREHRRMLQQQQHVLDAPLGDERGDLRLQAQPFVVAHPAEIEVLDHRLLIVATAKKTRSEPGSMVIARHLFR